ncbi:MAG: ABC transporter permease [Frankiaceae bacterium]|jgi:ABC-2 type transport system permease protein|nr:ABC transporter permease [Frankiaceae bacterium]
MTEVLMVARREIITRLQQRGFVIGALIVLVIVGVVAALPAFLTSGPANRYHVAVVTSPDRPPAGPAPGYDAPPDQVQAALARIAASSAGSVRIDVSLIDDAALARRQVQDGTLDAALDGGAVLVRDGGSGALSVLRSAVAAVGQHQALAGAGLSDEQIASALYMPPLALEVVSSSTNQVRRGLATFIDVVLFGQLVMFISWVAMGVVEEKSSRVVEIVLSAIRPAQLLAGKLLGIGALALAQLAGIAIVGLGVVKATGSIDLPPETYPAVAICFVWFLLGFALYSAATAAAASLVSRQEEVSGVLSPITVLATASYALGMGTANSSGALAQAVSVIPPLSALTMPARVAGGDVAWWQIALSLVLLASGAVAMIAVAARIYRAGVLHAGSRFPLRQAWRARGIAR